jgi:hypothetical protein
MDWKRVERKVERAFNSPRFRHVDPDTFVASWERATQRFASAFA